MEVGPASTPTRRIAGTIVTAAWLTFVATSAYAQNGGPFEGPPVLLPKEALPPDLVAGPDYMVVGFVYNDGAINRYTVNTSHGELIVRSTALLRLRILELTALGRLRELERSDFYSTAAGAAGASAIRNLRPLVLGVGTGTQRSLGSVDPFFGSGGDEAVPATPDVLQTRDRFQTYKRRLAYAAGVNPYSRLDALQSQMNDMAWTFFAAGTPIEQVSEALAAIPPALPPRSDFEDLIDRRVRDETPAQLKSRNIEILTELGVDESIARVLQSQPRYTPVAKTVISEALRLMKGVQRPNVFVERAALIKETAQAERIQRWAVALAGYHENIEPAERFVRLGDAPFLQTKTGKIVGVFEADLLVWTPQTARVVDAATQAYDRLPGATSRELWFVNQVTPMTRANLEQRGWKVIQDARTRLTLK